MKILCTADIHIGRTASRLIDRVPSTRSFSAGQAWRDIVQYAIDNQIDLLLIAGDIVDQENRFFEAYGPLEDGLRRLARHRITTIAVAGNHDTEVLPRLSRALDQDHFHLLGRDGAWERYTLEEDGRPLLHIDGWSFPSQYVFDNPLAIYSPTASDGVPILGLLHGDLGQTSSRYAPITEASLANFKTDLWLLGHIHRPYLGHLPGDSIYLYPGSPLALDPGEIGQHGPWILELEGHSFDQPRQIPLSRVRYEKIEISLQDIDDLNHLEAHISASLRDQLHNRVRDPGNPLVLEQKRDIGTLSEGLRHPRLPQRS